MGRTPDNGFRAADVQHILAAEYFVTGRLGVTSLVPFDAAAPGVAAIELREMFLVRFNVIVHVKADLFQVCYAGGTACLVLGAVQCGQQHPRQDCNDRYDYKELYERKTAFRLTTHA